MIKTIKGAQKLLGVKFDYNKEENMFSKYVDLSTRIEDADVAIFITDMGLTSINCFYDYEINETKRADVLEYIARVNSSLIKGGFYFDFEANVPYFQFTIYNITDSELIAFEINYVIEMAIKYANGFVEINEDGLTALDVIEDEE